MSLYEHVFSGVAYAHRWEISLHTRNSSGTNPGAHTAFLAYLNTVWNLHGGVSEGLKYLTPTSVTGDLATTYSVDDITGEKQFKSVSALTYAGTDPNTVLPPQFVPVLNLRAQPLGRSYSGRMFLMPGTIRSITGGLVNAFAITTILDAFQAALQDLILTGYLPIVYHLGRTGGDEIASIDIDTAYAVLKTRAGAITKSRTVRNL